MAGSDQVGDQIVSLTGNMLWDIARGSARMGGKGSVQFAKFLLSVLRQEKRTKGKIRLGTMLRSGIPTNIYSIQESKLGIFADEAKRFGIKYAAIKGKEEGGVVNFLVYQQDAPRITKIIKSIEETDIESNMGKGIIEADENNSMLESVKDLTDEIEKNEASVRLEPADKDEKRWKDIDFTPAMAEKNRPSEPNLKAYQNPVSGTERRSVRAELKEIESSLKSQNKTGPKKQNVSQINSVKPKKRKRKNKNIARGGRVNG